MLRFSRYAILVYLISSNLLAITINVPSQFVKISDAIANTSSGDTVLIAAGSYTDTFTINHPLTMLGASRETVKINRANGWDSLPTIRIKSKNVAVYNISVCGHDAKYSWGRSSWFPDTAFNGTCAISIYNCDSVTVSNCILSGGNGSTYNGGNLLQLLAKPAPAVVVHKGSKIVFQKDSLIGGNGSNYSGDGAYPGAAGLFLDSASNVQIDSSNMKGGNGVEDLQMGNYSNGGVGIELNGSSDVNTRFSIVSGGNSGTVPTGYSVDAYNNSTFIHLGCTFSGTLKNDGTSTITGIPLVEIPPAPILVLPSSSAAEQPVSLSLTWNTVSNASTYRVQVSTLSSFATKVIDDSTLTSSSKAIGPLSPGTTYYWHVNAKNTGGTSTWSDTKSFTTIPPVPGSPILSLPANNASGMPLVLSIAWNTVPDASTYRVQVSAQSSFATTVIEDSTLTSYSKDIGPLSPGTTYYWHVNAKNKGGTSTWSELRTFTTLPGVPSKISLLFPSANTVVEDDSVIFLWNRPSPPADKFCIEICTDSSMNSRKLIDSTITDTFSVQKNLENGVSYWWRVKANNIAGWGAVGEIRKFSVHIPTVAALPATYSCVYEGVFKKGSSIKYGLPAAAHVCIRLYDIRGKLLKTIFNATQQAGYHQIPIASDRLSKGYLILSFNAGKFREIKRMSNL